MSLAEMPLTALRGGTIFLVTLAAVMIALHTLLVGEAAHRAAFGPRARIAAPLTTAAFLALWFAVAVVVTDQAHFPVADRARLLPIALATLAIPLVLAVGALALWPAVRAINAAMPPAWLIRAQLYRLAGFIFLFPFLYYGAVSVGFAVTAAVGDMLTGALAFPVARAVERRGAAALPWARAWNALGILDLLVVPTVAVLTGARVIAHYPLGTIALFIGPPLGILTHVYSLRNLAAAGTGVRRAAAPRMARVQHA